MTLTIKETFKDGRSRIKEDVIKPWFKPEVLEFLKNHDVFINSRQLFSLAEFDDEEEYFKHEEEWPYTWHFCVEVDGTPKIDDYANDSEYFTSYMEQLL